MMPCYIAVLVPAHEPSVSQEREVVQMKTVAAFWSFKVHILVFVAVPCSTQAGSFSYVLLEDYGVKNSCVTVEELQLMGSQPQQLCKADKAASLLVLVITVFITLSYISSCHPCSGTSSLVQMQAGLIDQVGVR